MKSINAKFVTSSVDVDSCPSFNLKEFALIGRSNVGKSSFINKIANNFKLAKTSNTPGKTRLINLFNFEEKFIVADLPGYGYAKLSIEAQKTWQKTFEDYLLKRENLVLAIHFIDSRHEIQKNDFQMRDFLVANNIKTITILTKCDTLSKNEIQKSLNHVKKYFNDEIFPFSVKNDFYAKNVYDFLLKY